MAEWVSVGEYQASGAGAVLDMRTFVFDHEDDSEIVCATILPADYAQDSTTNPSVSV
jgi:hypothetical protein